MKSSQSIPTRILGNEAFLLLGRLLVGGWFIYLAIMKLLDPIDFLKQIHAYGIVPESMPIVLNTIAIALPYLEILCGLALILGVAVRSAGVMIAGMLLVFYPPLIYRALTIYHETGIPFCSVRFDCGCGTGEVYICTKLAENTLLLLLAIWAIFIPPKRLSLEALCTRRACICDDAPTQPAS